jgi:4-coumarate--CoA ligase
MKSRWSVDIPSISLPSLLFGSPDSWLSELPAFFDADEPDLLHLSFAEYGLWARRIAAGLLRGGLKPQDRVLVYSGNNIFFPVVFIGVIMAGGIVTTANPAFVARELAYQLQDSDARFLLLAESSLQTALQAAKLVNYAHEDMFIFDDGPLRGRGAGVGSVRHWSHLIETADAGRRFRWEEGTSPEFLSRTVAILYSSGTTGVPKGVEITHFSLVANCCQMDYMYNLHPDFRSDEYNSNNQRLLCVFPMYHGLGLLMYSTLAPYRRLPVYIMKRYSLGALFRNIERFRITELALAPPIVVAMGKCPRVETSKYDLSSIRKVHAGAAPLSREACAEFERLFKPGQVNVKQGWGMTESVLTARNPTIGC